MMRSQPCSWFTLFMKALQRNRKEVSLKINFQILIGMRAEARKGV